MQQTTKTDRKLARWGKSHLGSFDAPSVLLHLTGSGLSQLQIARMFHVSVPCVRTLMRKYGVVPATPQSKLIIRLTELGYKTLFEYFERNGEKTYTEMGRVLGMGYLSVARRYIKFVEQAQRRVTK